MLLVLAAVAAAALDAGLVADHRLPGIWTSSRLWLGAGLVMVALRLPAIAVDAWFEYRLKGRAPDRPVPAFGFLFTVVALALLTWVALVVVGGGVYALAAAAPDGWPAVVTAFGLGLVVLAVVGERKVRRRLPGRELALRRDDAAAEESEPAAEDSLRALAGRFGLDDVPIVMSTAGSVRSPVVGDGANASAVGVGPNRRVVLTEALLDEPDPLRSYVVAHELTHLARRHIAVQTALAVVTMVAMVQVLGYAAARAWPWSILGLDPLDPVGMPVAVLVLTAVAAVAGPPIAWVARAQERSADAGAIAAVGPLDPAVARGLYGPSSADLDPPWWVRLLDHHPTPAERLEVQARSWRTG